MPQKTEQHVMPKLKEETEEHVKDYIGKIKIIQEKKKDSDKEIAVHIIRMQDKGQYSGHKCCFFPHPRCQETCFLPRFFACATINYVKFGPEMSRRAENLG